MKRIHSLLSSIGRLVAAPPWTISSWFDPSLRSRAGRPTTSGAAIPLILSLSKGVRHLHVASGFTIIELLVAMAVLALLVPVLVTSIRQITLSTDRNTTLVTGLTQVENAARVLSRDIRKAQDTDLTPGGSAAATMTLYWTDWSDAGNMDSYGADSLAYKRVSVTYELVGSDLRRTTAICTNKDVEDMKCTSQVVTAPGSCTDPVTTEAGWIDNNRWLSGVVCNADGTINYGSWEADPTSPATTARFATSVEFSLDADSEYITSTFTSSANETLWPRQARTYQLVDRASLLGSTDPIQ